jgi:hypothetical protein
MCFLSRSPDTASPEDLRRVRLPLVEQRLSSTRINATTAGFQRPPARAGRVGSRLTALLVEQLARHASHTATNAATFAT